MDANTTFTIKPIGWVESSYEGGPAADVKATIELFPAYAEGAADIKAGDRLMVLFYFDRASEELLTVPLMGNGPLVGVFSSHAPLMVKSG